VKRDRNNRLLAAQGEVSAELNRAMRGRLEEVIVEGVSKLVTRRVARRPEGSAELGRGFGTRANVTIDLPSHAHAESTQLVGRTRGDQVVVFDGPESLAGRIVTVRITDARQLTLFAQIESSADFQS
jgi:tRNA-2-methylthio-N6-dimethylallyladenosine synthase